VSKGDVTLYLAGEVCVNRREPESIFAHVLPYLADADIRYFHQETIYAERGTPGDHPAARYHFSGPQNVAALQAIGFDVASYATNIALDQGREALLESIGHVRRAGIQVTGAGRDIAEARRPAVIERKGTRVAFLAYTCLLKASDIATSADAGIVPLRIVTTYEERLPSLPGNPPRIRTMPEPSDLRLMLGDIVHARSAHDVVVVAMHWGLHSPPAMAEYQPAVARVAIDAGADLIVGTGVHAIKPIEKYRGKAIFYGIGNFGFDFGASTGVDLSAMREPYAVVGWGTEVWSDDYGFPLHTRYSLLVKCVIRDGVLGDVTFVPVGIDRCAEPHVLSRDDSEFAEVVDYVKAVCEANGFDTTFSLRGEEIAVEEALTASKGLG
jgi:poly-gamma-glutamate synthesis protein (capsule biosynthesis protein)